MLAQIADTAALQNYYRAGYAIIRQYCPDCYVVINPREFELTGAQWQNFMAAPPYTKVLQDLHRCVRVAPRHALNKRLPRPLVPSTTCTAAGARSRGPALPLAGGRSLHMFARELAVRHIKIYFCITSKALRSVNAFHTAKCAGFE